MKVLLVNPAGHFVMEWNPELGAPLMTTERANAKRLSPEEATELAREINDANWVVSILSEALPKNTLVFSRSADGRETEVTVSACMMCKNYFWVTDTDIERPSFCPFCGVKFERKQLISAEEMRDIIVL